MAVIAFRDFNLGGVSDSKYQGTKNSSFRMVGYDIHSAPGLLKVNQKMTKDSSTTIDEFCKVGIQATNGIRYWFSSESGDIWQDKTGTYTKVYTTVPTSGSAACVGAYEYQGYIYFATEDYLHRIATADADGSSEWTANAAPNWEAFDNGNASHHPMAEVNQVLYVGDGYNIAQVDAGTFTGNALDLSTDRVVTAMVKMGTQLLVGASITNVNLSEIFVWNTYSTSFTTSDTVPEDGINSFIQADNYIYVNAGKTGSIYAFNGSQLQFYKRIPGSYSSTADCIVYPNASAIYRGSIPIFGVSGGTGDACDEGIWSLGRYSLNYPNVFNLEFPNSTVDGNGYNYLTGLSIGAIIVSGVDVYYSWKLVVGVSTTYGVDKLDYSNKIVHPFFETRVVAPDKVTLHGYTKTIVNYEQLPSGTSILIKTKENHAASYSETTELTDSMRKQVYTDSDSIEAKTLQIRVECVSSSNDAPTIEEVDLVVR